MDADPDRAPRVRPASRLASLTIVGVLVAACGTSIAPSPSAPAATATGLFDDATVHDVSLQFEDPAYDGMLTTYLSSGDKPWIEATVTIDGATYDSAGIRLKGNSSLRGVSASADPATLPWLVDLDQFVDGQVHRGVAEFVVRANTTATGLNEVVSLELLSEAGLASQASTPARFTVNGGPAVLRLIIENPDDSWMADAFAGMGALYKAESTGDYSYRGDDPAAYDDVFDQEAGKDTTDLTPLIDFLQFINTSDDVAFGSGIKDRLDVDAFATYLAMQELLDNFDDIDGPGNNSYLHFDAASGTMTVVPWDYNLAFGARVGGPRGNGGNGGGGGPGGGQPGQDPRPGPGGFGGGPRGSNVLVERFVAIPEYQALVNLRTEELRERLFTSGVAADILARRAAILEADASDLVSAATVAADAQQISSQLS